MAKYTFRACLNQNSLSDLVKQIEKYRNSLNDRLNEFVDELLKLGIETAYQQVEMATDFEKKHYVQYIAFSKKEIYKDKETRIVYLLGTGEMQGDMKPLSMMEWGSAVHALPVEKAFGGYGGKGTFITTGKNVDKESWHYIDEEGHWKTNHSVTPTRPMYEASVKMQANIERIAKKVFS